MIPVLSRRLCLLLVYLSVAGLGLSTTQARHLPNLTVLERDGYGVVSIRNLFFPATIDGHKTWLHLDTADEAPGITLNKDMARLWDLSGRPVKGAIVGADDRISYLYQTVAKAVTMGDVQIENVPLYVAKFHTASANPNFLAIFTQGLIGAEILRHAGAIVDLQNEKLYLPPSNGGRRADLGAALRAIGMASANLTSGANPACLVDVEINGRRGKMALATGEYRTTVDLRFAAQADLKGYRSNNVHTDAAGVDSRVDRADPKTFKLGAVSMHPPNVNLSYSNFYTATHGEIIGQIGLEFLGQNWSIIDFGQNKLYFAPIR